MSDVRERLSRIDQGFAALDETALHAGIMAALRQGSGRMIEIANLAIRVALVLNIASDADVQALRSAGLLHYGHPAEQRLTAALLELCVSGLALPEFQSGRLTAVHITSAGRRSITGDAASPHPLLDAYISALAGLPDEVVARLEDAARCFRAHLLRPAVVMVGVAYESAIESVATNLGIKEQQHAPRLDRLRQRVQDAPKTSVKNDERRDALQALSIAHVVADHRNNSGHPGHADPRATSVEDLVWRSPHWLRILLTIPEVLGG